MAMKAMKAAKAAAPPMSHHGKAALESKVLETCQNLVIRIIVIITIIIVIVIIMIIIINLLARNPDSQKFLKSLVS